MIKHLRTFAILAVVAGIFTTATAAHADSMYGPLTVSVWTGVGTTDQAALPTPTSSANFIFTYTGPLNFSTNNPANTFADFFGTYASDITMISGSESALLSDTMSTPGETTPTAINSYLSFVGNYTGGGTVTVWHDDGASLYTGAGNTNTVFTSANPTSEIPSTGNLPMGSNTPFDLVYVESNGAPSDLIVSGLSPVPEPGTIGLVALGMIGLGALMYRGSAFNS